MTLELAWFTAGRGPGSRTMFEHALHAIDSGHLDARISVVFMQRERGEGEGSDAFIDLVESREIPLVGLSARRFREERGGSFASHRDEYDARVHDRIAPYAPALCVLAGYLLILSGAMTRAYPFVNMHGALPGGPVGLWQKVIWQLMAEQAEESGAMTFLVTPELDRGPPIAYARFGLRDATFDPLWAELEGQSVEELQAALGEDAPLFRAIRREGLLREPPLLLATLRALASGERTLSGAQVLDRNGQPATPYDLTAQVNAAIAEASREAAP